MCDGLFACRYVRIAPVLFFVAAMGCDGRDPKFGQVSGTVVNGKEPLKSDEQFTWSILFVSPDGNQISAVIGQDGRYTAENVPVGMNRIAIAGTSKVGIYFENGKSRPPVSVAIASLKKRLARFKDPDSSGLSVVVVEGKQPHDVRLE